MSNNIIDKIQLSGITYDIGGQGGSGVSVVEVTQAEYDALPSSAKTDTSKMYVITDAEAGDLTNYYTKSETNTLLGGKQATLVSGTNIKTINNESLLGSGNIDIQGSGGKAIEAGRGISVITGETADTVSFNLPISSGSGTNSIIIGAGETGYVDGGLVHGIGSTSNGIYSNVFGYNCFSNGHYSFLAGGHLKNYTEYGAAFGKYNDTTNSPLFSVGNGTADNARHNAFEIRQNGDIYLSSGGTDIKLQDHLGGGGGSITIDPTLDSGSTNAVANSAVSAALNYNDMFLYRVDPVRTWDNHPTGKLQLRWRNPYNGSTATTQDNITLMKINNIPLIEDYVSGISNLNLIETSAITTSISSSSTDAQVPSAKAVNDKLGGLSLVKLTQAQYDALATKDSNTLYIVTDS